MCWNYRFVFIAPNYYRVHKRKSLNWKVNFGMSNIREECDMKPQWKKWIDLIYQNYPDMLTFDIDGIVDKNGKEYILEVNGSSQGFSPEHSIQDYEHLRDLVVRKMEVIIGKEMLNDDNEAKVLFRENNDKNKILENNYEKDTEIVNLKNLSDDYKHKLEKCQLKNKELIDRLNMFYNSSFKTLLFISFGILILILSIYLLAISLKNLFFNLLI